MGWVAVVDWWVVGGSVKVVFIYLRSYSREGHISDCDLDSQESDVAAVKHAMHR